MNPAADRAGVYLRVGVYIVFYSLAIMFTAKLLVWLGATFSASC
jgi:hypothetical protein